MNKMAGGATTVSIAMATCNGADYVAEQLDSLVRQTVLPDELVVSDDASTDHTADIVASFAASAPFPVRIERNSERLGYRANFMKAAGLCRSEIIAFCDQDDVWLPHKLAVCLKAFDSADVVLAYHNATVVRANLEPIGTLTRQAALQSINPPNSCPPWQFALGFTMLFRRGLLRFADLWPESIDFNQPAEKEGHDLWFFFLASVLGSIAYEDEPLALYRQHRGNTFGVQPWQSRPVSLPQRVRRFTHVDWKVSRSREIAARRRAVLLRRMETRLDGVCGERASAGAAAYERLEASYRRRREMYAAPTSLARLRRLVALIRAGGYMPANQGGVGQKNMMRDLLGAFVAAGPEGEPRGTRP